MVTWRLSCYHKLRNSDLDMLCFFPTSYEGRHFCCIKWERGRFLTLFGSYFVLGSMRSILSYFTLSRVAGHRRRDLSCHRWETWDSDCGGGLLGTLRWQAVKLELELRPVWLQSLFINQGFLQYSSFPPQKDNRCNWTKIFFHYPQAPYHLVKRYLQVTNALLPSSQLLIPCLSARAGVCMFGDIVERLPCAVLCPPVTGHDWTQFFHFQICISNGT